MSQSAESKTVKQRWKQDQQHVDKLLEESHWKPLPVVLGSTFQTALTEAQSKLHDSTNAMIYDIVDQLSSCDWTSILPKQKCCNHTFRNETLHCDYHVQERLKQYYESHFEDEVSSVIAQFITQKKYDNISGWELCDRAESIVQTKIKHCDQRMAECCAPCTGERQDEISAAHQYESYVHPSDVRICVLCSEEIKTTYNKDENEVYVNEVQFLYMNGTSRMLACTSCAKTCTKSAKGTVDIKQDMFTSIRPFRTSKRKQTQKKKTTQQRFKRSQLSQ